MSTSSYGIRSALQCKDPVPSDIEISQSITPVSIAEIAAECGLLPDEFDLYGSHKAKVIDVFVHLENINPSVEAKRCR